MADACEDVCIPQLDITQFEDIYNTLDDKVTKRLQEDYDCKKINGATYAATWAAMMNPAVGHILNAIVALQNKETAADRCVKLANCDLIKEQEKKVVAEKNLVIQQEKKVKYETDNVLPEQVKLTTRQKEGFDDNIRQKLFEAQMNAWAMMFSSGLLESMPCFIASDEASNLYKGILDGNMPSYNKPSDAECCAKAGGTWNGVKCTFSN